MPKLLCCGYGYTAREMAQALHQLGWLIAATARSPDKVRELRQQGVEAHAFQEGDLFPDEALADATHLLLSAPPGLHGDPFLNALMQADAPSTQNLRWIGYLSTTGVYGDHHGGWVTETSQLRPVSERARRRVMAERGWAAWGLAVGVPVQIFRLAGIYGPGRSALDSVRDGTARRIVKPGQVFSRIHVSDIANVLLRAIASPPTPGVFNVCDDEPAAPDEVTAFAAQLLGEAAPKIEPFESAQATMSEMARSFYADNKRVSNEKMKSELGVQLKFTNYREGLRAILNLTR